MEGSRREQNSQGSCGGKDSLGPAGPPPGRERLRHPQGVTQLPILRSHGGQQIENRVLWVDQDPGSLVVQSSSIITTSSCQREGKA